MTRSEVYKLIHDERDYPASRWHWDGHGCGIYLTYMDHYLREAVDGKSKMDACRDQHWFHAGAAIRKFAALAAAIEENGLLYPSEPPARDWVYAAIDEQYQRCQPLWPILRPPQEFPEELTLLRHYLRLAEAAWTTEIRESAVLDAILEACRDRRSAKEWLHAGVPCSVQSCHYRKDSKDRKGVEQADS